MDRNNLIWILDEHILNLNGTKRALLLSGDGLKTASSQGVDRDMADRMSAAISGMQSLSRGSAEFADCQNSPWQQTMIEYGDGYIFFMAAGEGAYLAVSTTEQADVEAVSYAMEKAIARLGREMGVEPRGTAGAVS
ncbi:roadblock/LC7 domain-containing protein [Streptomyces sp. NPDC056697]|uniref:roadblock/LC7 domain-containing protein n=1 Tax=Streptomyces sp. NPDC056697 TaxID=3345915 RepID=UPI0036B9BFFE